MESESLAHRADLEKEMCHDAIDHYRLPALALSVALASVPSFAQNASDNASIAKNAKAHKKTHKLAQGPAGLNYGAGGGYDRPWTGPAAGQSNPISGSPQDPGMRKPLSVPAR